MSGVEVIANSGSLAVLAAMRRASRRWIEPGAAMFGPMRCVAGAAVSGYAAGGHRIGAVRGSTAAASGGQCGKEVLGPGFTVGAFFCRARFFHWNAGAAPLCRRKPATKGRRLLCAAADASLLPYVHSVSLRAPQGGFPSPGSALAGAFFACGEGACSQSAAVCPESL
jgi:hypothetical protein